MRPLLALAGLLVALLLAPYGAKAQTINCQIPYQFSNLAFQAVAVCIDSSFPTTTIPYHQNGQN